MDFNYYVMRTPFRTGITDPKPMAGFQDRTEAFRYFNWLLTQIGGVHSYSVVDAEKYEELLDG